MHYIYVTALVVKYEKFPQKFKYIPIMSTKLFSIVYHAIAILCYN